MLKWLIDKVTYKKPTLDETIASLTRSALENLLIDRVTMRANYDIKDRTYRRLKIAGTMTPAGENDMRMNAIAIKAIDEEIGILKEELGKKK